MGFLFVYDDCSTGPKSPLSDPSVKQEHQRICFHIKCTFFLILKKIFSYFMCVSVLSAYVSVHPHVCLVPSEIRGGCQVPWSWSSGQL